MNEEVVLYPGDSDCIPSQTGTATCIECGDEFSVYENEHDIDQFGNPVCCWCAAGRGVTP